MKGRAALLLAALALAVTASPVAAAAPDRYPATLATEDRVVTGICSFDVQIHWVISTEYALDFYDGDGALEREIVTGRLVEQLTNADTGESITINVSGPAILEPHDDGTSTFTLRGRSSGPGDGTLVWTSGPYVIEFDAEGNRTFTTPHRWVDICALLS